jgi:GT2 family glycosyltransferase
MVFFASSAENNITSALAALSENDIFQAEVFAVKALQLSSVDSCGHVHALLAQIYVKAARPKQASQQLALALEFLPFNVAIFSNLTHLAQSGHSDYRLALFKATAFWLSKRPQDTFLPIILSSLRFLQPVNCGVIYSTQTGVLEGWAICSMANAILLEMDDHIQEHLCHLPTPELLKAGLGNGFNGFKIYLPKAIRRCRVGIKDAFSLWGSPVFGGLTFEPATLSPILSKQSTATVDLIIPVYKGLAETKACLDSVMASRSANRTQMHILVVNDASPDEALRAFLRSEAAAGHITLLDRSFNVGFVGAINTGLAATHHDVVLLNADTLVANNWLDRLQETAHSDQTIGTVTPLSNNAELLSFPIPMQAGLMLTLKDTQQLDTLFAKQGAGSIITIPTGVGFCWYIKRALLNTHPELNEKLIDRGYGEETEFCLQATVKGWRHVAATNVFVAHQGGVSFGSTKIALARSNNAQVMARFPEHRQDYALFLAKKPFYPLMRQVQRLWCQQKVPALQLPLRLVDNATLARVSVTHSETQPALYLLCQEFTSPSTVKLVTQCIPGLSSIDYAWPTQSDELLADLLGARISHLVFETINVYPTTLLETLSQHFSYQVILQDHSGYCPRRFRLTDNNRACDDQQISVKSCSACVERLGPLVRDYDAMIKWYSRTKKFLSGAQQITVMNLELLSDYQQRFPSLQITCKKPSQSKTLRQPTSLPRVLAIPRLTSVPEGFFALIDFFERDIFKGIILILGDSFANDLLNNYPQVIITGMLKPEVYQQTLIDYQCDALLDCSSWLHHPKAWQALAEATDLPLLSLADLIQQLSPQIEPLSLQV